MVKLKIVVFILCHNHAVMVDSAKNLMESKVQMESKDLVVIMIVSNSAGEVHGPRRNPERGLIRRCRGPGGVVPATLRHNQGHPSLRFPVEDHESLALFHFWSSPDPS